MPERESISKMFNGMVTHPHGKGVEIEELPEGALVQHSFKTGIRPKPAIAGGYARRLCHVLENRIDWAENKKFITKRLANDIPFPGI